MTKTIEFKEAFKLLQEEDALIIDTRSPKEFEIDNIPKSINIPIFSNEERAIVGTLYKNNKIDAYQKGFSIYNQKIIDFIKQFEKIDNKRPIIIYCWRGGMRSKTIADLVSNMGKNVFQLIGGYKQFREIVREELKIYQPPFKLIVLQGMAGCGKTDLIKKLTPSIDLEGLAKHRSSLFGAIGLKPVSQKLFESRLWLKLQELKNERIVFIEGEAKKVGNVQIPNNLFEVMQTSNTININVTIENRSKRIVRDYFTHDEDEKIKEIITKLKVQLGNKLVLKLHQLVDEKNYEPVAKILLEDYYDKQYSHALENTKYYCEINNDDINYAIIELNEIKDKLLKN